MAEDLSRYRILSGIGAGGMGEVFLAEDTRLSRNVALKLLPADVCSDLLRRARFLQEARTAAMLNHPNICTVFDAGEADGGRIYISMEYIEGRNLAAESGGRPIETGKLLEIAIQIAGALEEAHGKGIVHRDLKPSNLMLTPKGQVKVVDFGLARVAADSSAVTGDSSTRLHTSAGTVVGTVPYMSPEQAFGREIDARSDIFSFGVVLYQFASGRLPFQGGTSMEIIDGILHGEPPSLDRTAAPAELERIIRKCLEKDRESRYQSARDVLVDLRNLRRSTGSEAPRAEVRPPDSRPRKLPLQITAFVGRETELAELASLLEGARLVTVAGTGGSGKTRLAIEAASRAAGRFSAGPWFVDLAPQSSGETAIRAIADALDLKEESGQHLMARIGEFMAAAGSALLLLDNCEHLVEVIARVADTLLREAPDLTILATSRESLGIQGEHTWFAPPLSLPDEHAARIDAALRSDAVRLFVDRAAAVRPRFALTDANAETIAQICRQVDGIPLAIELAAARMKSMSADEIRKRLDDCFRLLTSGARAILARHQTLRAAVDWSYEILTPVERALFARFSRFSAGFGLQAAEGVCGFGEVDPADVADHLGRLVDKSLVVSQYDEAGRVRYRLLEPLRQYAAEKLAEAGDAARVARRHFEFFAELADRAYEERIERGPEWLDRLEEEHDNLRTALAWAAENDPDGEMRLAGALSWFWHLHCHFSEGRARLEPVVARISARTRDAARALWGAGTLAVFQGDLLAARAPGEESLAIWRELGDSRETALALESLGWSYWLADRNEEALARFDECLRIHTSLGDERLINRTNLAICQVLVSEWNVERTEPMAEKALAIALRHQEPRDIHNAYHYLADCHLIRGDVTAAEKKYQESLRAAAAYGDRLEMGYELEGIAMSLAGQGRDARALRIVGAVREERRTLGIEASVRFWTELTRRYLAAAEQRLGAGPARAAAEEGRRMGFDAAVEYALATENE